MCVTVFVVSAFVCGVWVLFGLVFVSAVFLSVGVCGLFWVLWSFALNVSVSI